MPRGLAAHVRGSAAQAGLAIGAALAASVGPFCSQVSAQALLDQYISPNIAGLGIQPGVTVLSRSRPEFDPIGINFGEITIRPQLLETTGFDDNVTGTPSARGSLVVETNAVLNVLYNHSDTTGFATLTVDDNRFPEQHGQNYTNWTAAIGGTHSFGLDTLAATYQHLNLNQTPGQLDVPQLNVALPFQVDTVNLNYRAIFARTFIQPAINISEYNYQNGAANGSVYLQNYRDRVVTQPTLTLGYELAPRRDLVLVVRDAQADYSNNVPGSPSRNFNDASVLAGLDFTDGGPFRYRVLVGYESRFFTTPLIKNISSPVVEGQVIWNPTGLTTVTGTADRRIEDSADEATVGLTETALAFRVDHEFQRDILLQANAAYTLDQYAQGQGRQELITLGTGATWLLNRNMQLNGTYSYTRRNSYGTTTVGIGSGQFVGGSYSDNRFLLQVRFAL